MAKKPKHDDKEQSQRFVGTAKELESDESGKGFKRAMDSLLPKKKPKTKKRP